MISLDAHELEREFSRLEVHKRTAWMAANDGTNNPQKSVKNFLGLTQRHGAALEGVV
jgi:hypothetical protein